MHEFSVAWKLLHAPSHLLRIPYTAELGLIIFCISQTNTITLLAYFSLRLLESSVFSQREAGLWCKCH